MLELHIRNERKIREMKIRIKYFEGATKLKKISDESILHALIELY